MPNTREKLIELLSQVQDYGTKNTNEQWSVTIETKCNETIADHLIANGVVISNLETTTFATDNNVGDKWIPVTERLPEDDEVVLIACKIGKMFVGYHKHLFPGYEVWRILTARDSTKKITYTVTHWMPLPMPPEGGAEHG